MGDLPVVEILSSVRNGDIVTTEIKVLSSHEYLEDTPVAPASIWLETSPEATKLVLHRLIARTGERLVFQSYGQSLSPPQAGATYVFSTWWRPDQLSVAQSDAAAWERREFTPTDGIEYPEELARELHKDLFDNPPPGFVPGPMVREREPGEEVPAGCVLVPAAWDHEHCTLCWKTIGTAEDEERFGYVCGEDWLCEECYRKYLVNGFGRRLG